MKDAPVIMNRWLQGGPFIGTTGATHAVATVEKDWSLQSTGQVVGNYKKGPVRWFQRADDSQEETVIPNLVSIAIDRSIGSDAASCTLTFVNQMMLSNDGLYPDSSARTNVPAYRDLGEPGWLTWSHGDETAAARWGHTLNEWFEVIVPDALIRTYQGYGGKFMAFEDARNDGYLVRTGTWLVDEVRVGTDGILEVRCRDMAKLLIEQICFPPTVPEGEYPVVRQRFFTERNEIPGAPATPPSSRIRRLVWTGSSGPSSVLGHNVQQSCDTNPNTFWISSGHNTPDETEYMEYKSGDEIDRVTVKPWGPGGAYTMYVSIMEGGVWQGSSTVPGGSIPYLLQIGANHNVDNVAMLPRVMRAQRVRVSFRDLAETQWAPVYRVGIREISVALTESAGTNPTTQEEDDPQFEEVTVDGNYKDWQEIAKDFLLWGGFHLFGEANATVHGVLETTGSYSKDKIGEEVFDKKSLMECINSVKELSGYIFFVDDNGGAHYQSPNWWRAGNIFEDGVYSDFVPEIDETLQLTDYSVTFSDKNVLSEIVIASVNPDKEGHFNGGISTRYSPPTAELLRGINRPFAYMHPLLTNIDEQRIMAELIAMHIWFGLRQGQVTISGNPCIQINDQVRIYERVTGESHIHYVRGIQSNQDLITGEWMMTLTTNWLGDGTIDNWAITKDAIPTGPSQTQFRPSAELLEFIKKIESVSTNVPWFYGG